MRTLHQALSLFDTPLDLVPVMLTEVINSSDPRINSPEMHKAILDEIHDLVERGASQVTLRHELPDGAMH